MTDVAAPAGSARPCAGIPRCPHRPPCLACPRFGDPGLDPRARTALDDLARAHGLPPVEVVTGALAGFRHRARLAIRGRMAAAKLGLFEPGSHRVVHIPECSVQHPLINRVAAIVRSALIDARVSSYSEAAHAGLARYLQVVVERASQTAQVVLVGNAESPAALAGALDLIRERCGRDLHSLWFNANTARGNAILGGHFERWHGPDAVVEHFGGAAIHYPPGAFGQSNLEIAARIIAYLRGLVPPGAAVAEFYAGVGAIGLSLLARIGELRCNESSPWSLQGLERGLAQLDAASRARVSVVPGAAADACSMAEGAQVVIVDPPRRGLDAGLLQHLCTRPPQRVIYVSCGLSSLLQQSAQLHTAGLRLRQLRAFNLLPFTDHVEAVACFDRA